MTLNPISLKECVSEIAAPRARPPPFDMVSAASRNFILFMEDVIVRQLVMAGFRF